MKGGVTYWIILLLFIGNNVNTYGQSLDYLNDKYWFALPDLQDAADAVPQKSGLYDNQWRAEADVFYIHPTTYYRRLLSNDGLRTPSSKRIAKSVIMSQASTFNQCYRIYAPKYRQAAFWVLRKNNAHTDIALNKAYEDVRSAFAYYLLHFNQGRPFVIAAHGQGSYHALRLLNDFVEDKALFEQFIAAYLPGSPLSSAQMETMFTQIKYASSPNQTGCIISWQTLGENGYYEDMISHVRYFNNQGTLLRDTVRLCNNPVSWDTVQNITVSADLHLGSVLPATRKNELKVVMENTLETKLENGFVYISKPKGRLFNSTGKNYHIYDYNLFYLNIRMNACDRLQAWKTH